MAPTPTPSKQPASPSPVKSKRERVRRFLQRSTSPSPVHPQAAAPSTSQPGTTTSKREQTPPPQRSASPAPIRPQAAAPSKPQLDSTTTNIRSSILEEALKLLDAKKQETIRKQFLPPTTSPGVAVEEARSIVKQLQESAETKQLILKYGKTNIRFHDVLEKLVTIFDNFKSVGDIIANIDPFHIGLPWAGVRIILQVGLAEVKQRAAIITGVDLSVYTCNRLEFYVTSFAELPPSNAPGPFRKVLVDLYAHVLQFLAHAIHLCEQPAAVRWADAVWHSDMLVEFETECNRLCSMAEMWATNCAGQADRQWKANLDSRLQRLDGIHGIREQLTDLKDKVDLAGLRTAEGASYDSSDRKLRPCLSGTCTKLLARIADWSTDPNGNAIFWLCGNAGTGKSTLSYTVAKSFEEDSRFCVASFFFQKGRDQSGRGNVDLLLPTIAKQLAEILPGMGHAIAAALKSDPRLCRKGPSVQCEGLLQKPLQSVCQSGIPAASIMLVIDALDECGADEAVVNILKLLSDIEASIPIRLRTFVTSRPDLDLDLRFGDVTGDIHPDVRLESIGPDIRLFYEDEFANIRRSSRKFCADLPAEWPGEDNIQALVDLAGPLFIFASTIALYISEGDPRERLAKALRRDRSTPSLQSLYEPLLKQLLAPDDKKESRERIDTFRAVVGPIIVLKDPLSASALSSLLNDEEFSTFSLSKVLHTLEPLHCVLNMPRKEDGTPDPDAPITLFHLSFHDFLVDVELKPENEFWIDLALTHRNLAVRCIRLLGSGVLKEDVCGVGGPGTRRAAVHDLHISKCLPDAVIYACCYWTQHLVGSRDLAIENESLVLEFLRKDLLHWMEAMSWLGKSSEVIYNLEALRSVFTIHQDTSLLSFLDDASRFALRHRALIDEAPLQIYLSALVFTPKQTVVRQQFECITGKYLDVLPKVPELWGAERVKLEGLEGRPSAVAISADGKVAAAAAEKSNSILLWSTTTGEQMKELQGHTRLVCATAISADGKTLVSGSQDDTVRLWSTTTGEQLHKFKRETFYTITTVAISANGDTGMWALNDSSVYLWTAQSRSPGVQRLKFATYEERNGAVALSADGLTVAMGLRDNAVRLWTVQAESPPSSAQKLKFQGHDNERIAIALSADGRTVASMSDHGTVRVWSTASSRQTLHLEGRRHQEYPNLALSTDGENIAFCEGEILWLSPNAIGEQALILGRHTADIQGIAISADGKTVVSGSDDDTVRVWSPVTGGQTPDAERDKPRVVAMAISMDRKIIVLGLVDKSLQVWDTATRAQTLKIERFWSGARICALAISADGQMVASASRNTIVDVYSTATGKLIPMRRASPENGASGAVDDHAGQDEML